MMNEALKSVSISTPNGENEWIFETDQSEIFIKCHFIASDTQMLLCEAYIPHIEIFDIKFSK